MVQVPVWLKPWPTPESQHTERFADDDKGADAGALNGELKGAGLEHSAAQSASHATHDLNIRDEHNSADSAMSHEREATFYRNGPSLAIPMTGSSIGFVAGFYTAAKRAGLVFMAENAHRRPDTVQGWYFYNKTKNYKVLLGGARGGIRTALRVGLWTSAYVGLESGVRYVREEATRDHRALSTTSSRSHQAWNGRWIDGAVAGSSIATGAAFLNRLPSPVTKRVALLGLLTGSSVGLLRDVQSQLVDAREEQLTHQ